MLDAVEFKLGDETFQIRPLFPALQAISKQYGGIVEAIRRIDIFDVDAIAVIVTELLQANGHTVKLADVGAKLIEPGLVTYVPLIVEVLTRAISAGPEVPVATGSTKSKAD